MTLISTRFRLGLITLLTALNLSPMASARPVALGRLSVASLRSRPSHAAEQISQIHMGHKLEVLERGTDWSRVRGADGYEGWAINHSLTFLSPQEARNWDDAPKEMITAPYELHDADHITDLVAGNILLAEGDSLRLPDGRRILRPAGATTPLTELTTREFRPEELPQFAALYYGVPYVWGGLSSKGMDCSGLVRMAYLSQGRTLPRDAWQQALEGREVPADSLQPGDLIFFGNSKTGKITHVAIYAGNDEYIHASQLVRRNSLNPASPLYLPLHVLHRRRISGTPLQ